MPGLWHNNPRTPEGKYLVVRRDGTTPQWPWFVLGAKDPCAAVALRAYVQEAARQRMDFEYIDDLHRLADEFDRYCNAYGKSDPTKAPPEDQAERDVEGILGLMSDVKSEGGSA